MLNVDCSSFQQLRPVQRRQEILFHLGEFSSGDRVAGDEDQFNRLGQFMLMLPEAFAEQPPGAAALHRAADPAARDDPEPGGSPVRQTLPVGDEAALGQTLSLLPDAREIAVLPEPPGAAQAQATGVGRLAAGGWDRVGHGDADQTGVRRLRPSRRRLRSVARPLLVDLRARNPCCRLRRIFDG